jgi:hypothetical protein
MKKLLTLGLLATLLGCHEQATTETPAAAVSPPPLPTPVARPRAFDYTLEHRFEESPADTLIQIGSRHYRLQLQAETDSTHAIDLTEDGRVVDPAGPLPTDSAARADLVRGYAGWYTFTLADSTGRHPIFKQKVNKKAFYQAAPLDIAVLTPTDRPMYLGYAAGLQALVFVVPIYPGPGDFGFEATLLLDATTGRVRHLGPAHSAVINGIDCNPRLAPNGRAVLTCSELLRAGRPTLNFNHRPHAQLIGARFLSDTTFLTVYEYGDERPGSDPDAEPERVVPPALRNAPNAFVYGLSGQVLASFHADWNNGFDFNIIRLFVPATRSYYFYTPDGVTLLRQARPDSAQTWSFRHLPRFKAPQWPTERADTLTYLGNDTRHVLYIDTIDPRRIRFQTLRK